jgi:hypothetical protein
MKRAVDCLLLIVIVLAPSLAAGQIAVVQSLDGGKPSQEDKTPTVKLVLHPTPEPRPALKYQLLPPIVDRRPGNAAVLYGKVTAEQQQFFGNQELWEKIQKWTETPLNEFPKEEAGKVLQGSQFKFLDRAARCEGCNWQLPLRDEPFYEILLPELQQTRSFGRMLAAKTRLQLAEGQLDEAVHTLQTGYALARHVGEGQTLINALVGIAISGIMSKQVETLIQQPGAPNLYWALTELPDPLVDMRPGIEAEWAMIYLSYPELRNLDNKDYSPEQWRERLNKLTGTILSFADGPPKIGSELITTALAMKGYPVAKQGLIEQGYKPEEVEAMPVPKVILLYTMRTYEQLRDDTFKWFAVPYPQALAGMEKAQADLKDGLRREVIPFAGMLLPALQAAHRADARGRRTIAALRVIEAVRLYGAAHDGNLPEKLAEITDVPLPNDPTTGNPFIYQRTGTTAILESPGGKQYGLRYELTFAPKGK